MELFDGLIGVEGIPSNPLIVSPGVAFPLDEVFNAVPAYPRVE